MARTERHDSGFSVPSDSATLGDWGNRGLFAVVSCCWDVVRSARLLKRWAVPRLSVGMDAREAVAAQLLPVGVGARVCRTHEQCRRRKLGRARTEGKATEAKVQKVASPAVGPP